MKPPQVFVIAPFFVAGWTTVLETVQRAVAEVGYETLKVDSSGAGAGFTTSVLDRIRQADLIVADVSRANPNVLYELGFAHALGKPTILLLNIKLDSNLPFDLTGFQYIAYDTANLHRLAEQVKSEVKALTVHRGV